MKIKFQWQNHNEFKTSVSWHDYVSIIVNEFPILLVRRYDWFSTDETTVLIQVFGFRIAKLRHSIEKTEGTKP